MEDLRPEKLERIQWTFVMLALVGLAAGLAVIIHPFVTPLLWALITALALWPAYRRLNLLLPGWPNSTAFIMTLIVVLLFAGLVLPLFTAFLEDIQLLGTSLNGWLRTGPAKLAAELHGKRVLGVNLGHYLRHAMITEEAVINALGQYQELVFNLATRAVKGLVTGVFNMAIAFFILFFLFRHGQSAVNQLIAGAERIGGKRFAVLLTRIKATVRASVYGVLATALMQGLTAGIGYALAGAPVPVFLGFLTMLVSLVPLGTPTVFVPVSVFLLLQGRVVAGIFLLAWGTGVVGIADNLLRPLFISQTTNMPLLLSFFGVVGGILAFGVIGVIIGPVIIAVAQAVWLEWIDVEKIEDSEEAAVPEAVPR